jgi:hypothetical protein
LRGDQIRKVLERLCGDKSRRFWGVFENHGGFRKRIRLGDILRGSMGTLWPNFGDFVGIN